MRKLDEHDEMTTLYAPGRVKPPTEVCDPDEMRDHAEWQYSTATTEARIQRESEAKLVHECHEIGGPESW